jgi:uncharacterized protein DUF4350
MTATEPVATARQGRFARHRSTLLIVGGLLLGVLVVLVLGGAARTSEPLDPDNPGPDGGRALARVLGGQGVDVEVVRSANLLEDAEADAGTTVLVTSTYNLGESTIGRLRVETGEALLVLAAPGSGVTAAFGYEPGSPMTDTGPRGADCMDAELGALIDGLEIEARDGLEYPAAAGCFYGPGGALVAHPADGVLLLGAEDVLRNSEILEGDNAAVALRLLGQRERVLWYVPDPADLTANDAVSLADLLPDWLRPGLWVVGMSLVALVLWRGRRLGPLATEPLPVVVKAIETTRSRGRLYRKADDRAHAADALRAAGRAIAAERLAVPATADPLVLVRAVARQVGRPVEEVGYLLHPAAPAPATDHDLITLATALAALEGEVRPR